MTGVTPSLRFAGNPSPWQRVTVRNLIERASVPITVQPGGQYREIGVRSHGKGVFHKPETTGARIGEKRVFAVQPGTLVFNIVFAWERAVAITVAADEGFIASHRFPMFRAKKGAASLAYLRQFFLTGRGKQFLEIASPGGAGRNRTLGQEDFLNLRIPIPSLAEQEKIAAVLAAVDARITLLTEERQAAERFKVGMMNRIFRRELRFRQDNGSDYPEWSDRCLGEVANFTKGRGVSKDDVDDNGPTPCIRYGEIYTRYSERIVDVWSRTAVDNKALFLSRAGDVILPASGETSIDMARACCILSDGVAIGSDINVLRSSMNGEFLAYFLTNARRREIARLAQGNAVVHLNGSHLKSVSVAVPHPDEQAKIAAFLSALDAKFNAIAAQIAAMRAFRDGLLLKLFP